MRCLFCVWFLVGLHVSQAQDHAVLFVGNSLTYTNDLPEMVASLGAWHGLTIETDCICLPNYGLEDHWNEGHLQAKIRNGEYDVVIFQQGPSSQTYGRLSLIQYGGLISQFAKEHGMIPA